MSKFIVFCADGTWNGPGQPSEAPDHTNVLKIYRMLGGTPIVAGAEFAPEQEKVLLDAQGGEAHGRAAPDPFHLAACRRLGFGRRAVRRIA